MGIKVELDYEVFDEAVKVQMKDFVKGLLDDPWVYAHNYRITLDQVDGFLKVIDWYMTPKEYEDYRESIKPQYDYLVSKVFAGYMSDDLDITVTNIRDLPDGSANIEYEATPRMKEFLMGVGLQKLLMDAVNQQENDTEVSTEDNSWDYLDYWGGWEPK